MSPILIAKHPPSGIAAEWDRILARSQSAPIVIIPDPPRINAVDLIVSFLAGAALGALGILWLMWAVA